MNEDDLPVCAGQSEQEMRRLSRRQALMGGVSTVACAIVGGSLLSACGEGDASSAASSTSPSAGVLAGSAQALGAPQYPLVGPSTDRFVDLMMYEPAADPDAAFFRSTVPLAPRIAALAATQAQPSLDPRPGAATLCAPYRVMQSGVDNDKYRRTRQAAIPPEGVQVPRRLGAHDIVVQWAGTGAIPNPATTDAAHRNGALCLGTIFQPEGRVFNGSAYPVDQVARQYVKLAKYFGFDGYFVNHENGSSTDDAQVAQFMAALRAAAVQAGVSPFHVQHYNGHTDLASLLPRPSGSDPAPSTIMPDQGWSGYGGPGGCCAGAAVQPSQLSSGIGGYGRTKYDIYYGFQLYPGVGFLGVAGPDVISPSAASKVYGGLQLYSLDDGLLNMVRMRRNGQGAAFLPANIDVPTIERMVYSGQTQNPALLNKPTTQQSSAYGAGATLPFARRYTEGGSGASDQASLPITYGIANFIAERSVIGALPFVTHFNEGEGQRFFVDGAQVSGTPWYALGAQDILPTWQWWRAPFAGLTDRDANAAGLLDAAFDNTSAYNGGTSLRITGTLGPSNATRLHLYKTDLLVPGGSALPTLDVVSLGIATDRARTRLGLIFADQTSQVQWLPLVASAAAAGTDNAWVSHKLDLRAYAGRRIAAILLGFQATGSTSQAIDIRFGRLAIIDGVPATPAAPTNLTLDRRVTDSSTGAIGLALRWQGSGRYDVFTRPSASGPRTWIGRIDGEAFYSPNALPAGSGSAVVEVQAIGAGDAGGAATIAV